MDIAFPSARLGLEVVNTEAYEGTARLQREEREQLRQQVLAQAAGQRPGSREKEAAGHLRPGAFSVAALTGKPLSAAAAAAGKEAPLLGAGAVAAAGEQGEGRRGQRLEDSFSGEGGSLLRELPISSHSEPSSSEGGGSAAAAASSPPAPPSAGAAAAGLAAPAADAGKRDYLAARGWQLLQLDYRAWRNSSRLEKVELLLNLTRGMRERAAAIKAEALGAAAAASALTGTVVEKN